MDASQHKEAMLLNTTLPYLRRFPFSELPDEVVRALKAAASRCRAEAVTMVTLPNSGHPAGSLSSMEMYLAVYGVADLTPENCSSFDRDYVAISHGHTSPAAYSALAAWGFFDPMDVAAYIADVFFQGAYTDAIEDITISPLGERYLGVFANGGVGATTLPAGSSDELRVLDYGQTTNTTEMGVMLLYRDGAIRNLETAALFAGN